MPAENRNLKNLLSGIDCRVTGNIDLTEITGLSADSRRLTAGNLFAAIQGLSVDGHRFLNQAVAAGCSALLVNRGWQEPGMDERIGAEIPLIEVNDTKTALGYMAAEFYGHPDRDLSVIGITGTNGKTTTSFILEGLLKACGKKTGVIGTVNYRYSKKNNEHIEMDAPFTTPESPTLFGLLREMADEGVTDVIMEVSSHALAQSRLSGMAFDVAVFTNLSRDHLDFHPDMDHYFSSKMLLFTDYLKQDGQVVIMLADDAPAASEKSPPHIAHDNDWGGKLRQELNDLYHLRQDSHAIITCGFGCECDVHPHAFTVDINGIEADIVSPLGSLSLSTSLVGDFNLRNLLCAIGAGISRGVDLRCVQQGLKGVESIPGRLEKISPTETDGKCPTVLVDYAHTPDALKNVLTALRKLAPGRLICIFGCGGDRDRGKRALMGRVAGDLSDVVLATSDNPRSESPEEILAQIEEGLLESPLNRKPARETLPEEAAKGYDIIVSRKRAIETAIHFANPNDLILISGKGHENYQLGSWGKTFFDDRIEAAMQLQAAAGRPHAWKLSRVQQLTGGHLLRPADGEAVFRSISTDSRTINPGDLFVGLSGENYDGSRFALKAIEKGGAGLLVKHTDALEKSLETIDPAVPVITVSDTLHGLGELAAGRRRWKPDLQVVAITGSSGKTTVKEMTSAILGLHHRILKTEGNLNNLIGLPLTLFQLKDEHEFAILEMGMNRPGEIARLTEIADPDIACIINVQEAHLEGLGDINGVARAKNELFAGLKPSGRVAVNLDDAIVRSLAAELSQEKITFGCTPEAFVRAADIRNLGQDGLAYTLNIGGESQPVRLRSIGSHNIGNSLAAAAMAHAAGIGIREISEGLAAFVPYEKRSCVEKLASGVLVFNDCYNANPASMLAALKTVSELKKDHRAVAILGDMLELGDLSASAHESIGAKVYELGIDFLAVFGDRARGITTGARRSGMGRDSSREFASKKDLVQWLDELINNNSICAGDWLLVKGSRSMRMEEILELLKKEQHSGRGN